MEQDHEITALDLNTHELAQFPRLTGFCFLERNTHTPDSANRARSPGHQQPCWDAPFASQHCTQNHREQIEP